MGEGTDSPCLSTIHHSMSTLETTRIIHVAGFTYKLHNEDCLRGLDAYADNSFRTVVTSPPYNIGISYNQYNDKISRAEYLAWLEQVAIKIKQKLDDKGSFFLNMGAAPTNPWGPFEVLMMLRPHFVLQNTIHWIKSIYVENESYGKKVELNVGHYKPINGKRFVNDAHEYIFHLTKTGDVELDRTAIGVPYKDQGNVKRWKAGGNGLRCRGNTWFIPYRTIQSRDKERPHPASFPPELAEMCIRLSGAPSGSTVLDPFMGIGNTAIACRETGQNFVGFDIDKGYYETAILQMYKHPRC